MDEEFWIKVVWLAFTLVLMHLAYKRRSASSFKKGTTILLVIGGAQVIALLLNLDTMAVVTSTALAVTAGILGYLERKKG